MLLRFFGGGEAVNILAVELVANAHLDLIKPIENIKLGQRDAVNAGCLDRLAHQYRIKPAAAALASCYGAELAATLADIFADVIFLLGRKRTGANARRIGLGDAEHIADGRWPRPEPAAACPATVLEEVT